MHVSYLDVRAGGDTILVLLALHAFAMPLTL